MQRLVRAGHSAPNIPGQHLHLVERRQVSGDGVDLGSDGVEPGALVRPLVGDGACLRPDRGGQCLGTSEELAAGGLVGRVVRDVAPALLERAERGGDAALARLAGWRAVEGRDAICSMLEARLVGTTPAEWSVEGDRVTWTDKLYDIYGLDRESFGATVAAYLDRVHLDDRDRPETLDQPEAERGFADPQRKLGERRRTQPLGEIEQQIAHRIVFPICLDPCGEPQVAEIRISAE